VGLTPTAQEGGSRLDTGQKHSHEPYHPPRRERGSVADLTEERQFCKKLATFVPRLALSVHWKQSRRRNTPSFTRISLLFYRRSLDLRGPLRATSAAL